LNEDQQDGLLIREYSHLGGVAMRYLGLSRNCCRQFLVQPGILRQETILTLDEMREGEKADPNILIYSRFSDPMEKPLVEAEKKLLRKELSVEKATNPLNSYALLCKQTKSSMKIMSALNSVRSKNLRIQNTQLPSNLSSRDAPMNMENAPLENIQNNAPAPTFLDEEEQDENITLPPPTFLGDPKEQKFMEALISQVEKPIVAKKVDFGKGAVSGSGRKKKRTKQTRQPGGLKLKRGVFEAI